MKTEASLLAEIAAAPTLREQTRLVAELDALRHSKTARVQADRDLDLAGAVVQESLTPVLTHSFHTASTDWLSEADIPQVDANRVHAEASLWFGKTSAMVKADEEEFTEQASGVARRLASQFGEAAPEAQRLFMDYVAFLLRREAASGLDQIQQTVAPDGKTKKTTPLPTETFDTFQPPIAPMNQGVDESQSTENAPLLNEIINKGQGEGQPEVANGHITTQEGTFTGPRTNGSGMQVGPAQGSLIDSPSVAQGYLYNLDDFIAAQAAIQQTAAREADDDSESSLLATTASGDAVEHLGENDEDDEDRLEKEALFPVIPVVKKLVDKAQDMAGGGGGKGKFKVPAERPVNEAPASPRQADNADMNAIMNRVTEPMRKAVPTRNPAFEKAVQDAGKGKIFSTRVEAASGLDQVEQILDSQENYDPKPLPLDVAFPLIPYFDKQQNTQQKESFKIASSVEEMLTQEGTDNPAMNKTHSGSEKEAEEPTNAMSKAMKHGSLDKTAAADFEKARSFAAAWTPGQPIVRQGSAAFEAGLYAGITANAAAQEAWLAAHEQWGQQFPDIAQRIEMHAAFTERIQAHAATTTDLEEMTPGNGLTEGPHGANVPLNGPGQEPPMAGGMDPAAPGGAAMYNGAEPFSKPVAPDPGWTNRQRTSAFVARIQQGLAEQS